MATDTEKHRIIVKNLSSAFPDPNADLDPNELKRVLDEKVLGGAFDDGLFEQLISQVEKRNVALSLNNFADIWLEAEKRLLAAIEKQRIDQDRFLQ